jgi:hypothetical protein
VFDGQDVGGIMIANAPPRCGFWMILVLTSTLALPSEVCPQEAQEPPPRQSTVTIGSKVRLIAPAVATGRITGTVIEMDEKALVILTGGHRLNVPRQAVIHAEVSVGKRRRALKGMIIGAGLGAVVYPPLIYGSCLNDCGSQWDPGYIAFGAGVGALWGAGIGALIKKDRWSTVPTEQVRLSLYSTRGNGFRVALSIAF